MRRHPWLGERPHLVEADRREDLIRALGAADGVRVRTVRARTSVPELVTGIGRALEFPEPLPRGWWAFNDYYREIDRLSLGPFAVVVDDADLLARSAGVAAFVGAVHRLLSIADGGEPWEDVDVRVGYFFVGRWAELVSQGARGVGPVDRADPAG
ncbi:hypothetical protein [Saccharothrix australiensis]|uniref:hypothetical protein n=1 Tax=Saccharothrix australiensis TaxID=2072 RepID=UPI0011C42020|nr:hypothetical protein [Saccharothrix australiensis]